MKNKDIIILEKILDYCKQVNEACDMFDNDYEQFKNKSVFQNACCMCILQIGELCKILSSDLRNTNKDIPWRSWCGVRDIFAHQYSNLDIQSAWDTIQSDLPDLETKTKIILNKLLDEQ